MDAKARSVDLIVFDDVLPSQFSPFRTIEYAHYLWFFDAAVVATEGWESGNFERDVAMFPTSDDARGRFLRYSQMKGLAGKLAYVTFLHNAFDLLTVFENAGLPFILQLYPGGGFAPGQEQSDEMLKAVAGSKLCRAIIATQTVTVNHLEALGVAPSKVNFIYGGVFNDQNGFDFDADKRCYPISKPTLDLCFVAHKYGDDVRSKGYDYFVAMAAILGPRFSNLRFHVVGGYDRADIALGEVNDRFTFYGIQPSRFFAEFYPRMDAVVSFNRPSILAPGAFDGFPTGSCIEAGLAGVLNIINDPLGLNSGFLDGDDFVLLDDDLDASVERVADLLADPARLYDLARRNWAAFHHVFDTDRQLWERCRILSRELSHSTRLAFVPPAERSKLDNGDLSWQRRRLSELDGENKALHSHVHDLEIHIGNLEAHIQELRLWPGQRLWRMGRRFATRLLKGALR